MLQKRRKFKREGVPQTLKQISRIIKNYRSGELKKRNCKNPNNVF